jgi:hypothetical protein
MPVSLGSIQTSLAVEPQRQIAQQAFDYASLDDEPEAPVAIPMAPTSFHTTSIAVMPTDAVLGNTIEDSPLMSMVDSRSHPGWRVATGIATATSMSTTSASGGDGSAPETVHNADPLSHSTTTRNPEDEPANNTGSGNHAFQ